MILEPTAGLVANILTGIPLVGLLLLAIKTLQRLAARVADTAIGGRMAWDPE